MNPIFFVLITLALGGDAAYAQRSLPLSISPLPSSTVTSPGSLPSSITFRGPGPVQPSGISSTGSGASTTTSSTVTSTTNSSTSAAITSLTSTTPLPSGGTGTSSASSIQSSSVGSGANGVRVPGMSVWAVVGGLAVIALH